MMERKRLPKIIGLILALMIFLAFGNEVSAFNIGDTVEVQNTGEIGLNARDSPAGDPTGWRKFDGDVGVILDGSQPGTVGGITYTWWKIRWSDGLEGWSAEGYPGGVYYLKVITTPSPPTLVSPSNGATGESLTPTFQWNSVSNADYYGHYISEQPYGPSNLVFDSEVDYGPIYGTSFTLPSGILDNGVKYHWNMRSHNSAGWGQQFSSSRYFTTEDTTTTTTTTTTSTTTSSTTTTSTITTTTVPGETTTTTTTTTTTSTTVSTTTTTSFTTTTTLNQPPNSPQTELITVRIDDQSAIPKEATVGESSTLKFSFTNTGNIPWTFYAAISLRKPNGEEENLPIKPVALSPNQQGSAEWTYIVDTAGNWDVVFGVWEEAEQENSLGYTGWLDGYIKGVTSVLQADYPGAELIPTDNKYTRDTREIRYIVIHYMDGYLGTLEDGTINWFKRPESEVSAHYLVGKNGRIVQMVKEKDIAWHAGDFNEYSIGIEHEDKKGGLTDPDWATEEMYQSSAALVRYLSEKYDIPKDRTHIVGHSEISKSGKQDPGPYWDWDYYMQLVKGETLDTTPPTISIIYPTSGQTFTSPTISVSGTASDNAAVSKVEIRTGIESWQTVSGTISWSRQVTLSEGSNTIYARATDTSGNTKETSVIVNYNRPDSSLYQMPTKSGKISFFSSKDRTGECEDAAWGELLGEKCGSDDATRYWYVAMRWHYAEWDSDLEKPIMKSYPAKKWWHNKKILVTNQNNGKQVVLAAKDWGPNPKTGKDIDVSYTALKALGAETGNMVNIEFADQNVALGPIQPTPIGRKVYIDPGHSPTDSNPDKRNEYVINKAVADKLKSKLEARGIDVYLTNQNDGITSRANYANRLNPDICVSLHSNAGESTGSEVWIYDDTDSDKQSGNERYLAQLMLNRLTDEIESRSRGVREKENPWDGSPPLNSIGIPILKKVTACPAVLVEMDFFTYSKPITYKGKSYQNMLALMNTDIWQEDAAQGIANGIFEYFSLPIKIQPLEETVQPEKPEQTPAQPAIPAMNEIEKALQPVIETVQDIIDKIRRLFGF